VNHFCKGVPVLLVGCKTDLRRDPEGRQEAISCQQASVTPSPAPLGCPPPWGAGVPTGV